MRYLKATTLTFVLTSLVLTGCGKSSANSVRTPPNSVVENPVPEKPPYVPGTATLAWDGSFSSPGVLDATVTGYRLYYGTATRDYPNVVDVGLAYEVALKELPRTTVFFAVTAYNAYGMESPFSDEVSANLAENVNAVLSMKSSE